MTLVGCDLHTRKQQVAVLDTETGEMYERQLSHAGEAVEQFYRTLPRPVTVGIESTGYALWFHELMQRLGHTLAHDHSPDLGRAVMPSTCSTCSSMTASPRSGFRIRPPATCERW